MADDASPAPAPAATPGPLERVDGRTRLVRVVRETKANVTQALGGPDAVTPQQMILIQQLAEAEGLRRALFSDAARGLPLIVSDYTALATQGQRALKLLGLRRRSRDVTLADYLEGRAGPTEKAQEQRSTATPADDAGCAP